MNQDKRTRGPQERSSGARQSHSERKRERKQKQDQMRAREAERPPEAGSSGQRKLPLPD